MEGMTSYRRHNPVSATAHFRKYLRECFCFQSAKPNVFWVFWVKYMTMKFGFFPIIAFCQNDFLAYVTRDVHSENKQNPKD